MTGTHSPRESTSLPDPLREIRITTLHATSGRNYWSRRPVTRLDLVVGAFDDISSADVPGVTERLLQAMPGLVDHHCSIGERGGFVIRLRRGTYVPHIVEHVALELQTMIGHDVGYGRTRGGDVPGEYTLVFEHLHQQVGLRAAALALETVQRAFAGTLADVDTAVRELASLATMPDAKPVHHDVLCGITGGAGRAEAQRRLVERVARQENGTDDGTTDNGGGGLVIDVSPAFLLQAGLPYARSRAAIVLDAELTDVPERYRDPERAVRLVSVLADAVERDGFVVCPASEWEVQDYARDQDCRVAVFATHDAPSSRDLRVASALATVRDGRIWLEHCGDPEDAGPVVEGEPVASQVAAALAAYVLRGSCAAAPIGSIRSEPGEAAARVHDEASTQ